MDNGMENQDLVVPEKLRKKLAVAVRSIQWSYAIFWSLSSTKQGVLEWSNGYYNGDIKTRKTVQAMELKPDKIALQRSEQLRQLYGSLLEGETEQQSKRSSASLSPEDLTDEEWYYLVCMSFEFNPGEGLPGRAFANGQTIWLCNAQYADSKVFSRSLLAKSASIQTVVCFPYLGGVIELGITEVVPEDPNLLQHIKVSLLDFSKPICSEKSYSIPDADEEDKEPMCIKVADDIVNDLVLENLYSPSEEIKFDQDDLSNLNAKVPGELNIASPDDCSNGCDSFMVDGVDGGASQVQSWHIIDDDFSNGFQGSINSSDCISEAIMPRQDSNAGNFHLKEVQECNRSKLSSLVVGPNDALHYERTISAILGNTAPSVEAKSFWSCGCNSSFISWKIIEGYKPSGGHQQVLKKILFKVPLMYGGSRPKTNQANFLKGWSLKLQDVDTCKGHALSAKQSENDKFLILRSMIPSITEMGKASILDDTILYLKELEARVEELESGTDLGEIEGKSRRKFPDIAEQISDNYPKGKTDLANKPWLNKRKACDIDETDPEFPKFVSRDESPLNIKVSMKDQEVVIEIRCHYREFLMLDVMEAINNLHLDAHSIQSSTADGILMLSLKSKFRGAAVSSVGMIKQTLWKVAAKC